MKKLTLDLRIDAMSSSGDGVSITTIAGERRAVFLRGSAPGDLVRAEVDPKPRPARGKILAVLEPSAARATPPCAYVHRCGGCDWMFLAPADQEREHARTVGRLLGTDSIDVDVKSHAAPRSLEYRTRARVHVEAKRGRVSVGMFARESHDPAEVDRCIVLDPAVDRARSEIATWLAGSSGRGEVRIALAHPAESPRRAVLDIHHRGEIAAAVFGRLERAVAEGRIAGVRIFAGDVKKPAVIGDPTPWVAGADGSPLRLAPGGFSQATEEGNLALARRVEELVRELPPGPCFELFAGAGNLTVLLACAREVTAVEQDADACAAARQNLTARALEAKVVCADANTFALPKNARLVVLDPPREGARAVAMELAARARLGRAPAVVYVACDPPTLARDVRLMTDAGYRLETVDTFEMFPHTSHVETIVSLTPPKATASARTSP